MRTFFLITLFATGMLINATAQNHNSEMEAQIKKVILDAEKAAAERNTEALEQLLHQDYRVIANRFKGSTGTTIMSREMYLDLMEAGKIGGTPYATDFKNILVHDHTATVELLWKANGKAAMHKFLALVQDENNQWKIISDVPVVL